MKNVEEDVKVSSKEIIEDKTTTIGEEQIEEDDQADDSSDSSVYSDLEEGKILQLVEEFGSSNREKIVQIPS